MRLKAFEHEFWFAENYGLIRRRRAPGELYHPEVWLDGRWQTGSSYVMDAITGMGEDSFSCGEFAEPLTLEEAQSYAAEHAIDLLAENSQRSAGD